LNKFHGHQEHRGVSALFNIPGSPWTTCNRELASNGAVEQHMTELVGQVKALRVHAAVERRSSILNNSWGVVGTGESARPYVLVLELTGQDSYVKIPKNSDDVNPVVCEVEISTGKSFIGEIIALLPCRAS
jgi:hypothetical protein